MPCHPNDHLVGIKMVVEAGCRGGVLKCVESFDVDVTCSCLRTRNVHRAVHTLYATGLHKDKMPVSWRSDSSYDTQEVITPHVNTAEIWIRRFAP